MEGLCHTGGGTDDLGVGGGGGQTGEDVLARLGLFLFPGPGGRLQPVRRAPQSDLPEGGQIFGGKKIPQGLPGAADLSRPQPL